MTGSHSANRVASIFPRKVGKEERGKRKAESGKGKERKLKKVLSVTKHGFVF